MGETVTVTTSEPEASSPPEVVVVTAPAPAPAGEETTLIVGELRARVAQLEGEAAQSKERESQTAGELAATRERLQLLEQRETPAPAEMVEEVAAVEVIPEPRTEPEAEAPRVERRGLLRLLLGP